MDEKTLSHILDQLAARQMSDDIDLLPALQARLKQTKTTRSLWQRPVRLIASMGLALLLVVTTVYAAQLLIRDPGLRETMVTPLTLSQTKDDITVTLDWGYADANRIQLAYTVTSLNQELVQDWVTQVKLLDRQTPRGAQEFTGYASVIEGEQLSPYVYRAEAYFEARDIDTTTQTLDLQLRVMSLYRFNFSLPFNPGIRIGKQPDVEVAGLKANIEWVVITPSMTRAYLCYETPDDTLWSANVVLEYDGQPVAREPEASGRGQGPYNGPEKRWCVEKTYRTSYETMPQKLTFIILSLQTPTLYTEEDMQRASEVFARYGVKTEVVPSSSDMQNGYTLNWLSPIPDSDEFARIWQEALAAMDNSERWSQVEGPWPLTVALP